MPRRESVGRVRAASQSESGAPTVQMVSCAVLPPRLPPGMAPPTGVGLADVFSFDESLNWDHNNPIQQEEPSRRKSLFRKVGLTTQRERANEDDVPPFVMRQIPYDTWRKHYAKDKDGNYRGTHAPAEDCLLKPEDVQKWRLGEAVTKADKWTRGREALPVYSEVREEGLVPEYQIDTDRPSQSPNFDPVMTPEDDQLAHFVERRDSEISQRPQPQQPAQRPAPRSLFGAAIPESPYQTQPREIVADGKTAEEIIAEARARPKPKLTWKQKLHKGALMSSMAGFPPIG